MVKAEGATELQAPAKQEGLEVRITDTRHVGDGIEAQVDVAVTGPAFY